MGRLIAFDPQTASALVAKTRTAAQLGHGSPLKAALANEGESTLLMRASAGNDLLVVNVRHPQRTPRVVVQPVARQGTRNENPRSAAPPVRKPAEPAPQASKPVVASKVESAPDVSRSVAVPRAAPAQQQANPVESAIPSRSDMSKAVLPTRADAPKKPAARAEDEPVAYEATGFLGLGDSPLYEEDLQPQPKKKWWRKILD
jgi:hypothetical protein